MSTYILSNRIQMKSKNRSKKNPASYRFCFLLRYNFTNNFTRKLLIFQRVGDVLGVPAMFKTHGPRPTRPGPRRETPAFFARPLLTTRLSSCERLFLSLAEPEVTGADNLQVFLVPVFVWCGWIV